MILYILRHAEAEVKSVFSDWQRKLTSYGQEQALRVGRFCKERHLRPDLVLTSPVNRARETAEFFTTSFKEKIELIEQPWLACGMAPAVALKELAAYSKWESLLLVGHEPDLSFLIATLLGLPKTASLDIKKASLTAISLKKIVAGGGVLEWMVPCELLLIES